MFDLTAANQALQGAEPQQVIAWALEQAEAPLVTTNFGPYEAVILHMVTQVKADIPVVWIDSGYNTRETYLVAERLIEALKLNIEVYTCSRWRSIPFSARVCSCGSGRKGGQASQVLRSQPASRHG